VRLLIATTNPHKLREIGSLMAGVPIDLISLADLPPAAEPEETGATFQANARQKALYYDNLLTRTTGVTLRPTMTVAEDSGLEIDALHGEPGVRSARFLGADATYSERFDEILRRLAERPDAPRTARFVCAMTVVLGGEIVFETTGTVEGEIATQPSGSGGFGYDPLFYFPPYASTLAQVTDEQKRRVSHRGQVFRALAAWIENSNRSG
jgi:XTP/dITP diphosphohydrolase